MRANAKISVQQISDNMGVPKRTIERIIKVLKEKGVVVREGTKNGKWIVLK